MSKDVMSRLLFGGQVTAHEVKHFLDIGRCRGIEDIRNALKDPERHRADMGRRLFRSKLFLEGAAILKVIRGLRQREAERYLGFGHLAQDVQENELERQHLTAQVNFEVLKSLVADRHVIPPDLDGLTAEDWYVAHRAEWPAAEGNVA